MSEPFTFLNLKLISGNSDIVSAPTDLEAIRAGVGLGLGPRLTQTVHFRCVRACNCLATCKCMLTDHSMAELE